MRDYVQEIYDIMKTLGMAEFIKELNIAFDKYTTQDHKEFLKFQYSNLLSQEDREEMFEFMKGRINSKQA